MITLAQIYAILLLLLAFGVSKPVVNNVQTILKTSNSQVRQVKPPTTSTVIPSKASPTPKPDVLPIPIQVQETPNTGGEDFSPDLPLADNFVNTSSAPAPTTLQAIQVGPSGILGTEPLPAYSGLCSGGQWSGTLVTYDVSIYDQYNNGWPNQVFTYTSSVDNIARTATTSPNGTIIVNYAEKGLTEGTVNIVFSVGGVSTTTSYTVLPMPTVKPGWC